MTVKFSTNRSCFQVDYLLKMFNLTTRQKSCEGRFSLAKHMFYCTDSIPTLSSANRNYDILLTNDTKC